MESGQRSSDRGEVVFRCGHIRYYPSPYPALGETQWCSDCSAEKTIVQAPPSYKPLCSKCSYGSTLEGQGGMEHILNRARRHVKSKKTHTVYIFDGAYKRFYVMPHDEGPLFEGPALTDIAKLTQGMLRRGA